MPGGVCSCPSMSCSAPCLRFTPVPLFFVSPMMAGAGVQQFHVVGQAKLWLNGSRTEQPTEGAAGWFSERFGLFRKQTEALSLSGFIFKLAEFFTVVDLKTVLIVDVDHKTVYSDKSDKKTHDLGLAVSETQAFLNSGNHEHNHLNASAVGEEDALHLVVEVQFYAKHDFGEAPFEINVIGVPSEFNKKENETVEQYKARMEQFHLQLNSPEKTKEFRHVLTQRMSAILDDHLSEARKIFDVEKTEKGEITEEGFLP